jgi:hypothetical protein
MDDLPTKKSQVINMKVGLLRTLGNRLGLPNTENLHKPTLVKEILSRLGLSQEQDILPQLKIQKLRDIARQHDIIFPKTVSKKDLILLLHQNNVHRPKNKFVPSSLDELRKLSVRSLISFARDNNIPIPDGASRSDLIRLIARDVIPRIPEDKNPYTLSKDDLILYIYHYFPDTDVRSKSKEELLRLIIEKTDKKHGKASWVLEEDFNKSIKKLHQILQKYGIRSALPTKREDLVNLFSKERCEISTDIPCDPQKEFCDLRNRLCRDKKDLPANIPRGFDTYRHNDKIYLGSHDDIQKLRALFLKEDEEEVVIPIPIGCVKTNKDVLRPMDPEKIRESIIACLGGGFDDDDQSEYIMI